MISVAEDESLYSWKKKIKILVFWMLEMIFVNAVFLKNSFDEITLKNIVVLIIGSLLLCVIINIYAIEFLLEKRIKNKGKGKTDKQLKKEKRIKKMFYWFFITIAIELIVTYFSAYYTESHKSGYKMIMVKSEEIKESKFNIKYKKDGNMYEMYPIAHENTEYYIITRLYKENGKIKIDYNYQNIIEKQGQETVYVDNIYSIASDN